jgi:hypothetical protein
MSITPKKQKQSFWSKLWKSLVALSVVLTILSPAGIKFNLLIIVFIVVALIFFVVYWHLIETLYEQTNYWKNYVEELRKDVDQLKAKMLKPKNNKKGNIGASIIEIIGAVILLYVLFMVIKALFFSS